MKNKIGISTELYKWLTQHKTMPKDVKRYDFLYGGSIFNELIEIYDLADIEQEEKIVNLFGFISNSQTAHLWLLINPDKWEVKAEHKYYICIPEKDGSNGYLRKDRGIVFNSNQPTDEHYKWTEEEIDNHDVAKHLKYFMKEVEK